MNTDKDQHAVSAAADELIAAFGRHDRETYFAAFAENATFLFHNLDRLLKSRAEYESEWKSWEENDQFRVIACRSSDRHIQMLGKVAVFTHTVSTDVQIGADKVTNRERETIIFIQETDGRWLGIHEHLSTLS